MVGGDVDASEGRQVSVTDEPTRALVELATVWTSAETASRTKNEADDDVEVVDAEASGKSTRKHSSAKASGPSE